MTDAIAAAIAQLEAEATRIERALTALRELSSNGTRSQKPEPIGDFVPASKTGELTIAEAVDRVLDGADRPLTIKEIRGRSEARGRILNPNSVRWTLRHAVEAGAYKKSKDGRTNLYKKR